MTTTAIKTIDEDQIKLAAPSSAASVATAAIASLAHTPTPTAQIPSSLATVPAITTTDDGPSEDGESGEEEDEGVGDGGGEKGDDEEEEEEEGEDDDTASAAKTELDAGKFLQMHPDMSEKMRETIPVAPENKHDDDGDEEIPSFEPVKEKPKRKKAEPKPKASKKPRKKQASEISEEADGAVEEGQEEPVAAEEEVEEEVEEEEEEEAVDSDSDVDDDEVTSRQRLMGSIKELRKTIVEGPIPDINMPVDMLKKIKKYYVEQSYTEFWIYTLSIAYTEVIGVIERANTAFDPFGRMFGPNYSLRLEGAKEAVEGNISRLRIPIKYYAKKLGKKLRGQYSPMLELVGITVSILSKVHIENIRKEAVEAYNRRFKGQDMPAMMSGMSATGMGLNQQPHDPPVFKPQQVYMDQEQTRRRTPPPPVPLTAHLDPSAAPQTLPPPQPSAPQPTPAPSTSTTTPPDVIDLQHPTTTVEPINMIQKTPGMTDDESGEESDGDDDKEDTKSTYVVT